MFVLIGGIKHAWWSFGFALGYLIARIAYHITSMAFGPNGRYIAVLFIMITQLALCIIAIVGPI